MIRNDSHSGPLAASNDGRRVLIHTTRDPQSDQAGADQKSKYCVWDSTLWQEVRCFRVPCVDRQLEKGVFSWSRLPELNRRPSNYESDALPTELSRLFKTYASASRIAIYGRAVLRSSCPKTVATKRVGSVQSLCSQ